MKAKGVKWALLFICLAAALASLPWVLNACGSSSSSDSGDGTTTEHTMTLKGATS